MPTTLQESALSLTQQLIAEPSVTPEDGNCQQMLIDLLEPVDFDCETIQVEEVKNLWAVYGDKGPLLVFAGHTDVVPTGDTGLWNTPPFEPTIKDGSLYGRGAADMKTGIAAMVLAAVDFLKNTPDFKGRLGFLITSDEEGPAKHGTKAIMDILAERGEKIDYCVVGEPSSSQWAGDTIKNGRRGSMSLELKVVGKQGHVAYPEQVLNPNHLLGEIISTLSQQVWDEGNDYFPPTSYQITDIIAGVGASNVVPESATFKSNFRFNTTQTPEGLQSRVQQLVDTIVANAEIRGNDKYAVELNWHVSGQPFLTEEGDLVTAAQQAIKTVTGSDTTLSTSGGTSDGRFIAPSGSQVVEVGVCNHSIHQLNENILVEDVYRIVDIYQSIIQQLHNNGAFHAA